MLLPPTLHVPYQSASSLSPISAPSSGSDPGPVVDISHGLCHSHLKILLFPKSSLHSTLSLAHADLLDFDHCVWQSLVVILLASVVD